MLSYFLIAVITLVALVLRLWHWNTRPFWLDEMHSAQVINNSATFREMLSTWWHGFMVSDPPLYYIFNWFTVGGDPVAPHWQMRLVSILFGAGTIPVLWGGLRKRAGEALALTAAAMLAINTMAIQYSQEYRPYSQLLFFTTLYFAVQLHLWQKFTWRRWLALAVAALMLIYTHYFGGFALAAGYIVWGAALLKQRCRCRRTWAGFILLPLLLALLYIPMIYYGLHQARHFSVSSGAGDAAQYVLNMYKSQKQHHPFWTDLPLMLVSYNRGPVTYGMFFLLAMAAAGVIISFIHRPRLTAALCATGALFLVLNYSFYEIMKYPYDPRRSIGMLGLLAYFQAAAVCASWQFSTASKKKQFRLSGALITIALALAAALVYGQQLIRYDSGGYRNQPNQADWPAMAEYLKLYGDPTEPIALYSKPGETWVSSHFSFYRNRLHVSNPQLAINTLQDFKARLNSGQIKGIWYLLCYPTLTPDDLFSYLLTHGQWKNFFGGSLVYVPVHGKSDARTGALLVNRSGLHSLTTLGAYKKDYSLRFIAPEQATIQFTNDQPEVTMYFGEGMHTFEYSPNLAENLTTASIYGRLVPGQWQRAVAMSEWQPSSKNIDVVLDDEFRPALYMQHNGNVHYRFTLDKPATYTLTLRVKNDAPGPIRTRIFMSNVGELKPFVFDRADGSFSEQSQPVRLKAGLNELVVDYCSFDRVEGKFLNPEDSYNEFTFSQWKLDPVDAGGSSKSLGGEN